MSRTTALLLLCLVSTATPAKAADQRTLCLECHDDVRAEVDRDHVHAAFATGLCTDCHAPHASDHAALLTDREGRLCAGCHEPAATAVVHDPVADGACLACHEPHAADHAGLLHHRAADLCLDCHDVAAGWAASPVVHAPVDAGECLACHAPHGSGESHLLRAAVPSLCMECHDDGPDFRAAHAGNAVLAADCTACHDPHAAERPGLMHRYEHRPYAGGRCETCHDADSFTVESVDALCLRCHRDVNEAFTRPFQPHLGAGAACTDCHPPHVAPAEPLLAARPARMCARCHDGSGIEPELTWTTHDAMDCTECHVPHGAANEHQLRSIEPDLCARCHERAHAVSHPVGPEVIDPRTEQSVTCLSCHQLHAAPFPQYLPLDPGRDLCILCHKR